MENNMKSNKDVKPRGGKPPSRLQKKAPGNIKLGSGATLSEDATSPSVIPLLSPLVLHPPPLPNIEGANQGSDNKISGSSPSSYGWQHPASPSLPEHSSIFSSFQSQCVVAHKPQ